MKLITDLNKIKKLSEQNDRENWNFRAFLKGYDANIEEKNSIDSELYKKISSEIDCTKSANYCKKVQPVLYQDEIKNAAKVSCNNPSVSGSPASLGKGYIHAACGCGRRSYISFLIVLISCSYRPFSAWNNFNVAAGGNLLFRLPLRAAFDFLRPSSED